jgi:pilus assembly protein Flp/PilA
MVRRFLRTARRLFGNIKGATAIEYGLIAALIAIAGISAMGALGSKLTSTFKNVSSAMR